MTLVIWALIVAYLAGLVTFARFLLRRWHKAGTFDAASGFERVSTTLGAVGLGLIWPLSLGFLHLSDWLLRPVDRDEARRKQGGK